MGSYSLMKHTTILTAQHIARDQCWWIFSLYFIHSDVYFLNFGTCYNVAMYKRRSKLSKMISLPKSADFQQQQ